MYLIKWPTSSCCFLRSPASLQPLTSDTNKAFCLRTTATNCMFSLFWTISCFLFFCFFWYSCDVMKIPVDQKFFEKLRPAFRLSPTTTSMTVKVTPTLILLMLSLDFSKSWSTHLPVSFLWKCIELLPCDVVCGCLCWQAFIRYYM